jgi:holo-[acyl-carrier protein] synthase
MITGIGVDIVEVERIHKALQVRGDRFAEKILSTSEYQEYQSIHLTAAFVAKRFAMKEAFVKALGTGMRDGLSFSDIAIEHDEWGKPSVRVAPHLQHFVEQSRVHISVSDEKNTVVAFAVIERQDGR